MSNTSANILLIDDDEDDLFFHRKAIQSTGLNCEINVCTSGDIALNYLTNQGNNTPREGDFRQPDLIFLDINMPRLDGWEFLRLYEKWLSDNDHSLVKTVVIMLSTSSLSSDIARAKSISIVKQYVSKPLKPEVIKLIIKEVFPALN